MAGNSVNIVFLFDANYLAPALVSVASLFDIPEMRGYSVTWVYVSSNSEKDTEAANILRIFQGNIQLRHQQISLHLIVLQGNQFSDYVQRYHRADFMLLVWPSAHPQAAVTNPFDRHRASFELKDLTDKFDVVFYSQTGFAQMHYLHRYHIALLRGFMNPNIIAPIL